MTGRSLSSNSLVSGGIAVVVLAVAVVSLLSRCSVDRDQKSARLYEDCGVAMADLTHDALDGGTRILVLEQGGSGMKTIEREWLQIQTDGFYATLKSGLEISRQRVGEESTESGNALPTERMRLQGFAPLANQAPDVDVIVSFIGEPPLGQEGVAQWKGLPPVVCFSSGGDDVPALMEAGVIASAIVPRRTPVPVKDAKRKSWFEVMHVILTPENLSDWVALGNG